MTIPSNVVQKWARSMSGCDGGNQNAPVWLCGIEPGGGGKGEDDYYKKQLEPEIANGEPPERSDIYNWAEHNKYRFGKSFAKLYSAYKEQDMRNYLSYTQSLKGDEVFKLNLYPIAFVSTNESHWHYHDLDSITGFSHKHLFNLWCEHHRFPYFAELRKKHHPELIVCCGLNYLSKFLLFFGADAPEVAKLKIEVIPCESGSARNAPRRMYVTKIGMNTLFVCIPFFSGSYGLNSNQMLTYVGNKLRELRAELCVQAQKEVTWKI